MDHVDIAAHRFLDGPGEAGLVSVVIPTYNRAYSIGEAVRSALRQTHSSVEVLVADDGSTDDSRQVIERIIDARVRYFYQPNAGCPAARNLAIRHARGEFVALLDSDDQWMPWKLEAQVALLRARPEVGMVWTDMSAVDDRGRVVRERHLRTLYGAHRRVRVEEIMQRAGTLRDLLPNRTLGFGGCPFYVGDVFSHLLLGSLVHTPSLLLRRERLRQTEGFNESLRPAGEDYDFHLRTAAHGPVAFLDAPSMYYRVGNDDQITAPRLRLAFARNNLKTVLTWTERGGTRVTLPRRVLRKHLAGSHRWIGIEALQARQTSEARAHLRQSLRLEPLRLRTIALLAASVVPSAVLAACGQVGQRFAKRRYAPGLWA